MRITNIEHSVILHIDKCSVNHYNDCNIHERVNTMLFGKFCIDFGSTQSYETEHCVEPNQIK